MYIVHYQKKGIKGTEDFRTWKQAEAWASEMRAKGYEVEIEKVSPPRKAW